ncbi:transposase [Streptomyces sp. NPDC005708]|uniref:transposase n=1 Tax=Streptomyces sp. NPDC005708 TaxID=3154564 RepID=UPI0033D72420
MRVGRDAEPPAGVIDSQSVKADAVVGTDSRGFDGGKLVNRRKRHVVVDTLGLLLEVMVTAADIGGCAAAHHRLARIWADGGYTRSLHARDQRTRRGRSMSMPKGTAVFMRSRLIPVAT